jgi:pimeloyl-ACP methyl ester carboxylesterase
MFETRTRTIAANGLSFTIDETGEGDCVALMLHGFPESRLSWRAQAPALAQQGWRAVAPDLRGYGASSRPKGVAAYRIEHLLADVGALFDVLGARRRLLVAHDWGGIIAWAFAADRIRALDGLVIMNAPHPAAYLDLVRRNPAQMAKSWYVLFFQLPALPEVMTTAAGALAVRRAFTGAGLDSQLVSRYAEAARAPGAMTAMMNYYRANTATLAKWSAGRAARIDVPTLVLWGEEDPYLSVELAQSSAGQALEAEVARFAGVGHWVQMQAAGAVNARLAGWMAAKGLSPPA